MIKWLKRKIKNIFSVSKKNDTFTPTYSYSMYARVLFSGDNAVRLYDVKSYQLHRIGENAWGGSAEVFSLTGDNWEGEKANMVIKIRENNSGKELLGVSMNVIFDKGVCYGGYDDHKLVRYFFSKCSIPEYKTPDKLIDHRKSSKYCFGEYPVDNPFFKG